MTVMLALLAGTALAMLLLVLYSHYLFEENRTRVTRGRSAGASTVDDGGAADEMQWRTLVDPVEAANRARASKPFAAAYARAMTTTRDDSRAA